MLLIFGAPLAFGPASGWATSSTDGRTAWKTLHDDGGTLHGVVLLADAEGRPHDVALYLLGVGPEAGAARTLIAGQLRAGAFSGVVATPPASLAGEPGSPPTSTPPST